MKTKGTAVSDQDVRKFLDGVARDIVPKMKASAFVLCPLAPNDVDIFMALQIGAAILLEKPLLVIATGGVWVPPKLRRIADIVVEGELKDPETQQRVHEAVKRLTAEAPTH